MKEIRIKLTDGEYQQYEMPIRIPYTYKKPKEEWWLELNCRSFFLASYAKTTSLVYAKC
jgi:hypothetical protein